MSSMICGKCQSESTYYQGVELACMKCGNRSPSRWGFHKKGEKIKPPEPTENHELPELEDEEIEQEEIDDMAKKRTPEQIERIRAGIRAAKAKKAKASGVPAEMPPEKVKILKEIKTTLPDPLPIAKIEGQAITLLSPDPRIVLLDFTLDENADLYEPWVNFGRSHRRAPGDQAMMAVEEILTKEGLI
jgi:hypothetical protein